MVTIETRRVPLQGFHYVTFARFRLYSLSNRRFCLSVSSLNMLGAKSISFLSSQCLPLTKWAEQTRLCLFGDQFFLFKAWIHACRLRFFIGNRKKRNLSLFSGSLRFVQPTTQQEATMLKFCHTKVLMRTR